MTLTNSAEVGLLNRLFAKTSIFDTVPAAPRIALFTADPTDTGSLANEVANAFGYARFTVVAGTFATTASGSPTEIANIAEIAFPAANGGSWGTVTHAAYVDGATLGAGTVLFVAALTASRVINDGDVFRFPIGDLTFQLE